MAFDWRTVVSGLSSALPQLAETRATNKRMGRLAEGEAIAMQKQAEADRAIGEELTALNRSNPEQERVKSLGDYTAAVRHVNATPAVSIPGGLASDRFAGDAARQVADVANYGGEQAGFAAAIDAPVRQRENERASLGKLSGRIQQLGREAQSGLSQARLRAARVRPNPWIGLLSKVGSQIANNYDTRTDQTELLQEFDLNQLPKRREPIAGG